MGSQFETFQTITQAPKYEMNRRGDIRNKSTGQLLRWYKNGKATLRMNLHTTNRKTVSVTLHSLLWQLFGIEMPKRKGVIRPVAIAKGNRSLYFETSQACAKFLAKKESYSVGYTATLLSQRRRVIFGWTVNYLG